MNTNARGKVKVGEKASRFFELEGLRGLAAVMVVLSHYSSLFYPQLLVGLTPASPVQHMRFEDNLYTNPIAALWSGSFAVAIFFVLSGFVLSIGFLRTGKVEIIKRLAAKRYIRLVIPAFFSVLVCYLLIKFGLSQTEEAAAITQSSELAGVWSINPSLWQVIRDSTFGIFFANASSYNPVLWTMTIEFLGSFLIFATLLLAGNSKYRWVVYGALLVITFNSWFMAFVIGMVFADLHSRNVIAEKKRGLIALASLSIAALYLGGYPYGKNLSGTAYGVFELLPKTDVDYRILSLTFAAALLVFIALTSHQLAELLRKKYVRILGKYTFPLYLVHLPILFTFSTGIFALTQGVIGYNKAVLLTVVLSVPLIWVTTFLFEKYIDKKAIIFSSYCADVYFGAKAFDLKKQFSGLRRYYLRFKRLFKRRASGDLQPSLDSEIE